MKLRLRIGRQRDRVDETDDARSAAAPMPSPRTPDRRVVRAGAFCRVGEIGQTAVTETGRAVVAIGAGRCGRWVYQ